MFETGRRPGCRPVTVVLFGLSLTWSVQMHGWWICTSPSSMWASSLAALLLVTLLTGEEFKQFCYHLVFHIGHNYTEISFKFDCVCCVPTSSHEFTL